MAQNSLMERVQRHERTWGNIQYTNRPTLSQILNAPVVAFWSHPQAKGDFITLHQSLKPIEEYYTRLLFAKNVMKSERRLVDVYRDGKRMRVKRVRLVTGHGE